LVVPQQLLLQQAELASGRRLLAVVLTTTMHISFWTF